MIVWKSTPAGGGLADGTQVIEAADHGFTVGDGIYETFKVVDGHPMRLEQHLARMSQSAKLLELAMPNADHIRDAITAVAGFAVTGSWRMRVTLSSGTGAPGLSRGDDWTLLVTASLLGRAVGTTSLKVAEIRRNQHSPLIHAKTCSAAELALAVKQASDAGFDEALLLNLDGKVTEAARANLFAVFGRDAVTPPLTDGCLPGVTRAVLLNEYGVTERSLTLDDLYAADEVFVTSSIRGILHVTQIEQHLFKASAPVTDDFVARFKESEVTA